MGPLTMRFLGGDGGGGGRRFGGVRLLKRLGGSDTGDLGSLAAEVISEEEEDKDTADDGGEKGHGEGGEVCRRHRWIGRDGAEMGIFRGLRWGGDGASRQKPPPRSTSNLHSHHLHSLPSRGTCPLLRHTKMPPPPFFTPGS
ncbi:hypothetical protein BHM03_00037840 [Ensete ventricosum]|nr:hypothetical protein BHM03_00037840 [Ensete ventricosum]